ncbi:unnamed protein product [Gongylonema pulchrum]|uniref:Cell differentiation protein RQCD1 homolog n=1 Tax=Gongylonema pulchrum TaxID=637853 RepID=A0A183CZA0_9BILA|nr:unnamed protein product [Gongylonema pulchrum]
MPRLLPNSALEKYVCHTVTEVLIKLFEKPSVDQPIMDVTQHRGSFSKLIQSLGELQFELTKKNATKSWYRVVECVKRLSKCGQITAEDNGVMLPANVSMPPVSSAATAKQRWQSAAHSARFINISQANARSKARLLTSRSMRTTESFSDVVSCYQAMVIEFKVFALPLQAAETSVLVDVLHAPERLFTVGSDLFEKCENGGVIAKLIQHCKSLLQHEQETLCVRVLQTLCRMASSAKYNFISQVRYFLYTLENIVPYSGSGGREQGKDGEVVELIE